MYTICSNAATITVNKVQADYIDVYSLYSFVVRFHELLDGTFEDTVYMWNMLNHSEIVNFTSVV